MTEPNTTETAVANPAPAAETTTTPAPAATPAPATTGWEGEFDAARAKAALDAARADAKAARAEKTEYAAGLRKFGIDPDRMAAAISGKPSPLDPSDFEKALAASQAETLTALAENRSLRLDGAVSKAVIAQGGNPELLPVYLRGSGVLTDLDPSAEGFEKSLTALVKGTLEKNPSLKLTGKAPLGPNTAEIPAGSGGESTPIDPKATDFSKLSPEAIVDLRRAGMIMGIPGDKK
jgi:hypothetical protein